jgi:hypothetical protein
MLRTTRKERRTSAVGQQANHQYPSGDNPFLDSLLSPFTFHVCDLRDPDSLVRNRFLGTLRALSSEAAIRPERTVKKRNV